MTQTARRLSKVGTLFFLLVVASHLAVSTAQAQSESFAVRHLGTSTLGHPIQSYRFGTGWQRVIFVGGIHGGYERNTVELAWQIIDHFSAEPSLVPKSVTLEIIPVANPDGLAKVVGSAERVAASQRTALVDPYLGRVNGNGVDLNRNWDCNWIPMAAGPRGRISGGSKPMSEVETRLLADYLSASSVVAVVFWHSSANGVYAGGCEGDFPAANGLAHIYADASGYPFRPSFSAYPINGDVTNWLSLQHIPAITIELRTQSSPEFDQNLGGLLAVLDYYSQSSTLCTPIQVSHFYAKPIACKTWLQP